MSERIESSHFPYLPLRVAIRNQRYQVEALMDTGFDGHVIIPRDLFGNGTPADGRLAWTLADGTRVLAPYYLGSVRIGTVEVAPVLVSVLGDEPLVGRAVIEHFRIILDHGQRVIVEP